MMYDALPTGLTPMGCTPTFTEDNVPEALQHLHTLGPGRWGVLQLLGGSITYVDLTDDVEHQISAPDLIIIGPGAPHKVQITGPLTCRIDFFREAEHAGHLTLLIAAQDQVVASFERCEEAGDFANCFYDNFLGASAEIAPHFAQTDFAKQRKLLRGSVHTMVTRDPSGAEARRMLLRIGDSHSRNKLNVPPRLYEFWLDSLCDTVRELDPEWSDALEKQWRLRMRAGIQLITAEY